MDPLEQVFPIENGDFPASYVRIPVLAFSLHHGIRCVVLCDTLYPWQVDGDSYQISRCTWVKLHNQMCLEICTSSTCTVDGSEIPNNHPGMYKHPINNGINYQPQLVSQISSIGPVSWESEGPIFSQCHGFPHEKIPSLIRRSIRGTMMCFCNMKFDINGLCR